MTAYSAFTYWTLAMSFHWIIIFEYKYSWTSDLLPETFDGHGFCKSNFPIFMNLDCLHLPQVKGSLDLAILSFATLSLKSSVLTFDCRIYLGKKQLVGTPYRSWWRYFSWIHESMKCLFTGDWYNWPVLTFGRCLYSG